MRRTRHTIHFHTPNDETHRQSRPHTSEPYPLTQREYTVLCLLTSGRRNAEIAASLELSIKSVEAYVSRLLVKFAARSRTEVVSKALNAGLVFTDEATLLPTTALASTTSSQT